MFNEKRRRSSSNRSTVPERKKKISLEFILFSVNIEIWLHLHYVTCLRCGRKLSLLLILEKCAHIHDITVSFTKLILTHVKTF